MHKEIVPIIALGLAIFVGAVNPATAAVVGTTTLDFEDTANARKLTSELWFEAQTGSKVELFSPLPPVQGIEIARSAKPAASSKRPLIVVSHGNWGTRFSQGYVNRELVQAGFIVLSVSHPGTMNGDQSVTGRTRLWDRSRDITIVLDQLLANPQWRPMIDENRIGFVGHSFGGFTGVSLAGGLFDLARQREACIRAAIKDIYCTAMLTEDSSQVALSGMQKSYRDDRFKAFYIMASGPARGFSTESLVAIRKPFLVDTARFDDVLEPISNSNVLARLIPGAKEIDRPAGHFTYVPECKPLIGKLLAAQICTDPKDVDRAAVHAQITKDVNAFFIRELLPVSSVSAR